MGRISRMGDRYLRRLLVVGMTSLVRRARIQPASVDPRLSAMLARKPVRLVTVAAANRTARVAWAIMTRGGTYRVAGQRRSLINPVPISKTPKDEKSTHQSQGR